MLTLEDLLQELEEMGVSPGEITIPYRWYHRLQDQADESCEETEED